MTAVLGFLFFLGSLATAWLLAAMARRVLGYPIGWPRTIVVTFISLGLGSAGLTALFRRIGFTDEGMADGNLGVILVIVALMWGWVLVLVLVTLIVAELLVPTGSIPGPLTTARRLRAARGESVRYAEITSVLIRHGLAGLIRRGPAAATRPDRQTALALRRAFEDAGVTFVKFGQMLSTRRDLLPEAVADELAGLQTSAAPLPWAEVRAVLVDSLGAEVDDVFEHIDHTPIAAASVGQVHAARLIGGRAVVVKVQRPAARTQIERDVAIIRRLAARMEREAEWARNLGVVALADGFAASLTEELDYTIEADNIRNVDRAMAHEVALPLAHSSVSTRSVLVMDRVPGVPVGSAGEVLAGLSPEIRGKLAATLLREVLGQVLAAGVFHADLHPGNVLVTADGDLGLIDFGAVGRLGESERIALTCLLRAVDTDDAIAATGALVELFGEPAGFDRRQFDRQIGQLIVRYRGGVGADGSGALFAALVRAITSAGFTISGQVAAVFRTIASLEGTLLRIDPDFNLVTSARAATQPIATSLLSPDRLTSRASGQALGLIPVLQRLPGQLTRISDDLQHGRTTVSLRLFAHEEDRRFVRGLAQNAVATVIAAACIIAAVLLLVSGAGPEVGPNVGLYPVLGAAVGLIGAVLGIRPIMFAFSRAEHRPWP